MKTSPKSNSSQPNPNAFLKYFGLSFQLFAVIALGTWIGWMIQQKSEMKFPLWILLFCFLFTAIAFYQLFVNLKNDERAEQNRKKE
mgnify:CR=1 FL=1